MIRFFSFRRARRFEYGLYAWARGTMNCKWRTDKKKLLLGPGVKLSVYAAFAIPRETGDEPLHTVNMIQGGKTASTRYSRVFYGGINIRLKICLSLLN